MYHNTNHYAQHNDRLFICLFSQIIIQINNDTKFYFEQIIIAIIFPNSSMIMFIIIINNTLFNANNVVLKYK